MASQLRQELDRRGVLTLSLDRPELHNAFGDELIAELTRALEQSADDAQVRLLVITGQGRSFSAGADLNWMQRMVDASPEENEADACLLARMLRRLNYHPRPTIARVNGAAIGGGVGLVSCCDIAVAADQAQFALTEVRLGLLSPFVFRAIGERQARRYFLSGERINAVTAKSLGLVHEVVDSENLDQAVEQLVESLLQGGPQALRQAKRRVHPVAGHDNTRQRQQDEDNARLIARLRVSAEGQEGLRAFLDKRSPSWR